MCTSSVTPESKRRTATTYCPDPFAHWSSIALPAANRWRWVLTRCCHPLDTRSTASRMVISPGDISIGGTFPGLIPPSTPRSKPGGTSVRAAKRAFMAGLVRSQYPAAMIAIWLATMMPVSHGTPLSYICRQSPFRSETMSNTG